LSIRKISPAALSSYEQLALLRQPNPRAPTGLRNLCMIALMLKAGLRVNEIINIKRDDFDWQNGKLFVKESGSASSRVLKIGTEEMNLLKRWNEKIPKGSSYFFTTLEGRPLKDRYIREMVKRMARKAGLNKDVHPHLLRHTFAFDFIRETRDVELLQKALGHRGHSATQNYARLLLDELGMPYNGSEKGGRSGYPLDSDVEGSFNSEIERPEAKISNNGQELLKTNGQEQQLSVFNNTVNDSVAGEVNNNVAEAAAEKMKRQAVAHKDVKDAFNKNGHDRRDDIKMKKELKGQKDEMCGADADNKDIEKEKNEQVKMTDSRKENTTGSKVRIPPIKCCFCNYILQFKGDCPQCGASFESILKHWRRQL
jgi:integrase/recombinase XerD